MAKNSQGDADFKVVGAEIVMGLIIGKFVQGIFLPETSLAIIAGLTIVILHVFLRPFLSKKLW